MDYRFRPTPELNRWSMPSTQARSVVRDHSSHTGELKTMESSHAGTPGTPASHASTPASHAGTPGTTASHAGTPASHARHAGTPGTPATTTATPSAQEQAPVFLATGFYDRARILGYDLWSFTCFLALFPILVVLGAPALICDNLFGTELVDKLIRFFELVANGPSGKRR